MFWCKLSEDGNYAGTCRNQVMKRTYRLLNWAFVGVTGVSMYHNARNEQCVSAWGVAVLNVGRIPGHETVFE
jgi:hypothetical protein